MTHPSFLASSEPTAFAPKVRAPSRGLVFIGLTVTWARQIRDLDMNLELAERWERHFGMWDVSDRKVVLSEPTIGYTVSLGDGVAVFRIELPAVFDVARQHALELLEVLRESRRRESQIAIEAQYLEPVEVVDFGTLVDSIQGTLLNTEFSNRLGLDIEDLAYLVDARVDGQWCQVNAGPVRAHEIPGRVSSRRLGKVPELAVYYSVASHAAAGSGDFDLNDFLSRVFRLGDTVATEVMP